MNHWLNPLLLPLSAHTDHWCWGEDLSSGPDTAQFSHYHLFFLANQWLINKWSVCPGDVAHRSIHGSKISLQSQVFHFTKLKETFQSDSNLKLIQERMLQKWQEKEEKKDVIYSPNSDKWDLRWHRWGNSRLLCCSEQTIYFSFQWKHADIKLWGLWIARCVHYMCKNHLKPFFPPGMMRCTVYYLFRLHLSCWQQTNNLRLCPC